MLGCSEVRQAAQALALRCPCLNVFVAALADKDWGLFDFDYPMPILLKGLRRAPTHASRLGPKFRLVRYFFCYFFGILFHIACLIAG
jgi:hypothetical protein